MTKNIFKKLVFTLLLGTMLTLNSLPVMATVGGEESPPKTPPTSGEALDVANPTENQLLYQFNYATKPGEKDVTSLTKIGAVNALPKNTWQEALSGLVKMLLNISGALTLIALTLGGVFMITAHGSTEMIEKGKKIVLYAIGGLIVIAVSYAIVIGVSELQFFTPGTPQTAGAGAPAGGGAPAAAKQGESGGTS